MKKRKKIMEELQKLKNFISKCKWEAINFPSEKEWLEKIWER